MIITKPKTIITSILLLCASAVSAQMNALRKENSEPTGKTVIELGLTERQVVMWNEINVKTKEQIRITTALYEENIESGRNNPKKLTSEYKNDINGIKENRRKKLKSILDKKQYKKYCKLIDKQSDGK